MSLFGGQKTKSKVADKLGSIKIQSQGYGNVIPLIYGTVRTPVTLFFYSNFMALPVVERIKTSGKGGKKKKPTNTTFMYFASIMMGIASNEITGTGRLWVDKNKYTSIAGVGDTSPSKSGFTLFKGDTTQVPWGYLTTYEPTKAVALRGFAYMVSNLYSLSDTASLGNHTIEVYGGFATQTEGDASPADFIPDIMVRECGIASDKLADLTVFRAYCVARDLSFGVLLDAQKPAAEFITEILNLCGVELVIKNGLFHFISYVDAGLVTGYEVSNDDFIVEQGQAPITPTRKKAIDSFNALKLEFINRANDYNTEIAEDKDLASIETIGLRTAETLTASYVSRAPLARQLVHYLLQRDLAIRNSYEFTLSLRYSRLEPMDIITLTDAGLGLVQHPVIIKKIVITSDYQLKITAEDYVSQVYQPTNYAAPVATPYAPDHTTAVGNINPPVLFIAPTALTVSGYEIWCALSNSNPLYGGCDIHLSLDGGVSYSTLGTHTGNTRMGVLTADLATGLAIDTVNTLAVDLTQSNGQLTSVTQLEVDTSGTLCRVGSEFLAYRDVTLTGIAHYDVSYLRRGLHSSIQGAVTGDKFIRCDDTLFKFAYDPAYVGTTVYLKFTSFNVFDDGGQDLSTVPAYAFTIPELMWNDGIHRWNDGSNWQ